MPSVHLDDIPSDSDDIGQSAMVGHLLATGIEEKNKPFKIGDLVLVQDGIAFRDPKTGIFMSKKSLDGRRVAGLVYVKELVVENHYLTVVGWSIELDGFDKILFPAHRFIKKT